MWIIKEDIRNNKKMNLRKEYKKEVKRYVLQDRKDQNYLKNFKNKEMNGTLIIWANSFASVMSFKKIKWMNYQLMHNYYGKYLPVQVKIL